MNRFSIILNLPTYEILSDINGEIHGGFSSSLSAVTSLANQASEANNCNGANCTTTCQNQMCNTRSQCGPGF